MTDDTVLMPVATALALASVALQTSLEDATRDATRATLRRAQKVVERLVCLPPEVLNGLDALVLGRGANRASFASRRGSSRRTAARVH